MPRFKKARFLQFVTLLMVVVLMAGCRNSNEPAPTPEPTPDVEDFKIEILATTPTTVAFRITPRAEQMRYVAMMVEREDFDYFDSEEMYIEDDLYWFEQQAYDGGEICQKGQAFCRYRNRSRPFAHIFV